MKRFTGGGALRPLIASIGVYALMGLVTPAAAAEAASTSVAADDGNTIEPIIVTARRRSESIQTTPLSVTAISPTQLQAAAAPDIRDLAGRAPSLVIDQVNAGPSAAAISIRGISFEDIEKSFDPAVGVLIDDVYIGTNTGQLTDAFDLQSVQVLRGPQGTLFGRNTIGGVNAVQRTRPTGELGGSFDILAGDYGRQEGHAVLNLPKVGDQLSTKLFYSSRKSDGYERNVTLKKDTPGNNIQRYGVSFLWTPTDNFDADLTLEHGRERSHTDQAPLSNKNDLICNLPAAAGGISLGPPLQSPAVECGRNTDGDLYTTYANKLGVANNDEDDATLQANWSLGAVRLASITAYRKNKEHVTQDFDASSINFFDTVRDQDYHQFSQELRATGNVTASLDYVAGLYYFDSKYSLAQATNYGLLFQSVGLPAQGHQLVDHESKSYAAFFDLNWRIADKWRATLGGRYTKDEKEIHNNFVGAFNVRADKSWSEFTPKASLDFQATDKILFYGSFSKGFRSGGFNGRGSTIYSSTTPYNPETVDAFELGAKTEWLDNRLILNVAAFSTDYKNKQEEVVQKTPPGSPNPQETIVANAATAKIQGVEFDLQAQPARNLSVRATLGLLDAKYDGFSQVDETYAQLKDDLSNLKLRRAPKATGGVGFDYKVPTANGDWTFTADYRYIAAHETAIAPAFGTGMWTGTGCATATAASATCAYIKPVNDQRGHAQASNTVDASLSWDHPLPTGSLRLSVFGRNITDDQGLSAALPVAGLFTFGTPRAPRTWGVQLGYRF
ncbi:TonB-dependent receptor [Phenylobacterium aquaticum]|uniref:TonB-dependent receptor n=4 Tax=Phenylobacterium aquaticum TaxID=1763816 RepID=UPI0026EA1DAE|nr:TonB-dependent receptor [Phenylobacterium aquaticum]